MQLEMERFFSFFFFFLHRNILEIWLVSISFNFVAWVARSACHDLQVVCVCVCVHTNLYIYIYRP